MSEDIFTILRQLLLQPPSSNTWKQITQTLETVDSGMQEAAVAYLKEHIEEWEPRTKPRYLLDLQRRMDMSELSVQLESNKGHESKKMGEFLRHILEKVSYAANIELSASELEPKDDVELSVLIFFFAFLKQHLSIGEMARTHYYKSPYTFEHWDDHLRHHWGYEPKSSLWPLISSFPGTSTRPSKKEHEEKLFFNPSTSELYASSGALIKKLECPLQKKWGALEKVDKTDIKRKCHSCQKHVLNVKMFSAKQVQAIVEHAPETCLHLEYQKGDRYDSSLYYHVVQLDSSRPHRVIQTARTLKTINQAAEKGYWPLVKPVEYTSNKYGVRLYQHKHTGILSYDSDWYQYGRRPPPPPNTDLVGVFNWTRNDSTWPIAAYLIPKDLQSGEKVYLADLIEYHVAISGPNGSDKLASHTATWNGQDFNLDPFETEFWMG